MTLLHFFCGIWVYTQSPTGMPWSKIVLEEQMCHILDLLQDDVGAKLTDNLCCGSYLPEELLSNWWCALPAMDLWILKLSISKIVIYPKMTTILICIWSQKLISARPPIIYHSYLLACIWLTHMLCMVSLVHLKW